MSNEDAIYTLVASSNRGRYAGGDSEHGPDLSSGQTIAIEVKRNLWIEGHVEHAGGYDGAGCYAISDAGQPHQGPGAKITRLPRKPLTQEEVQQRVKAAMQEGMSLADALDSIEGKVTGLFAGYYFTSTDGLIIGLCTGMRVKLL